MKKILTLLSLMTLMILSCGNGNTSQEKKSDSASTGGSKKYRIGITQIVAHPALDSAREGFKAAFKEAGIDADFDEKNANGEAATANLIANSFVSSKEDLIYSIATSTAQAAAQSTNTIPVVFSAITDPESAGILKNNVTGVSDRVDIKQQLQLLLKLDSKIKKVPTDNLVASVVNLLTDKATAAKKIVFGAESAHVKGGALITQGIDYYEMGKQAGKIAIDILKNGKKPSEIKYQRMSLNDIVVNGKTMAALGITLPEDIKSKAKIIN